MTYVTMHDFKVPFCMKESSSIKIRLYEFHVDNNKVELGFVSGMIIGRELMI